jgi:hypothetical protein
MLSEFTLCTIIGILWAPGNKSTCFISLHVSCPWTLQHEYGNSPLKLIRSIIKKSKYFLASLAIKEWVITNLLNCVTRLTSSRLLPSHTYTQAVRCLNSSANKTAVLPTQGTHITQQMCWMNQLKRTGYKQFIRELWVLGKDIIIMDFNN